VLRTREVRRRGGNDIADPLISGTTNSDPDASMGGGVGQQKEATEMIAGGFSTRTILVACFLGLLSVVTGGGALLGVVDGSGVSSGMWLAFNVVTTIGLGVGPLTGAGQLLSIGLFVLGGICWFGLLLVAIEIASMRFQKNALIDEALRPLARRPRSRLFHVN
jgi:hypothetical protein